MFNSELYMKYVKTGGAVLLITPLFLIFVLVFLVISPIAILGYSAEKLGLVSEE